MGCNFVLHLEPPLPVSKAIALQAMEVLNLPKSYPISSSTEAQQNQIWMEDLLVSGGLPLPCLADNIGQVSDLTAPEIKITRFDADDAYIHV